ETRRKISAPVPRAFYSADAAKATGRQTWLRFVAVRRQLHEARNSAGIDEALGTTGAVAALPVSVIDRSSLQAAPSNPLTEFMVNVMRCAPVLERIDRAQLARELLAQQCEGAIGQWGGRPRYARVPERIDRAEPARELLAQQFEGEFGQRSRRHGHAPDPERIDRAQLARELLAQQFEGELGH